MFGENAVIHHLLCFVTTTRDKKIPSLSCGCFYQRLEKIASDLSSTASRHFGQLEASVLSLSSPQRLRVISAEDVSTKQSQQREEAGDLGS